MLLSYYALILNVPVHPVIQVPNQLVGAPLGTDVTLECILEAFPKAISYWIRDNGTCNFICKLSNYRVVCLKFVNYLNVCSFERMNYHRELRHLGSAWEKDL